MLNPSQMNAKELKALAYELTGKSPKTRKEAEELLEL